MLPTTDGYASAVLSPELPNLALPFCYAGTGWGICVKYREEVGYDMRSVPASTAGTSNWLTATT